MYNKNLLSNPVLNLKEKKVFFAKPADKSTANHKYHFCSEIHKLYLCKRFNDLTVVDCRDTIVYRRIIVVSTLA
jgi:hypothetical protein